MAEKKVIHILGEGYLQLDNSHSKLEILHFLPVKGKCNGVFIIHPPKGYQRKKWRIWIQEIDGLNKKKKP